MNYQFKKYLWGDTPMIAVKTKYGVINNLTAPFWTFLKIQEIIDGIKQSEAGTRYEWATEDIHIAAFKDGVVFYDLLARRANKAHHGVDLVLPHGEFIKFLQDLKYFIEQNK